MPEVILTLDSSGAIKGLRDYENEAEKAGDVTDSAFSKMSGVVSKFGKVAGLFSAAMGSALTVAAVDMVRLAGNLTETQNKFDVVFNGMTDTAELWADDLQKNYSLTENASKKFLASTQDLLKPMGMVSSEAGKMSFEVAKLAVDLGSFNDLPTSQVMDDIQSALVGNYETMKKYGVVVNATTIAQEALNTGLVKNKNDLTASQKAQVAFNLIVKGSADAIGDWNRSQDSFNNQLKTFQSNIETLRTEIGEYLLPYANQAITAFNQWATESNGLNTVINGFLETVRFLYNGFMGLKLVLDGLILGFAYLTKGVTLLLKPWEYVLSGLEALGAIDSNPLRELSDTMDDFVKSAEEGVKRTWEEIETMNNKIDAAKIKTEELGVVHAEVTEAKIKEEKAYQTEMAKTMEYIATQHNMMKEKAAIVSASTDTIISALNGESDALSFVNGKWINTKNNAAQYGRIVASYVAPSQDRGKDSTIRLHGELDKIEKKFKEAADCADCYSNSVNRAADASDRVSGGSGGDTKKTTKKSFTFHTFTPKSKEDVIAAYNAVKDMDKILNKPTSQQDITLGRVYGNADPYRYDPAEKRRDDYLKYLNLFKSFGGSDSEWLQAQAGTLNQAPTPSNTVNVNVTQSVSRSDVANIVNEIERTEARS